MFKTNRTDSPDEGEQPFLDNGAEHGQNKHVHHASRHGLGGPVDG